MLHFAQRDGFNDVIRAYHVASVFFRSMCIWRSSGGEPAHLPDPPRKSARCPNSDAFPRPRAFWAIQGARIVAGHTRQVIPREAAASSGGLGFFIWGSFKCILGSKVSCVGRERYTYMAVTVHDNDTPSSVGHVLTNICADMSKSVKM